LPNRETAPGVTCWSRRGRCCYLFLLRHFSRALDAATGEPDYEMLWRREWGLRLAAPPGARRIGSYLYSGIQALDNKAPI